MDFSELKLHKLLEQQMNERAGRALFPERYYCSEGAAKVNQEMDNRRLAQELKAARINQAHERQVKILERLQERMIAATERGSAQELMFLSVAIVNIKSTL